MRPKTLAWLPVLGAMLAWPAGGVAQTLTSGTIAGVVRDSTGAVLPGVTVEAASPVLIEGTRTAVTDAVGQYKIVDLRPGTYSVSFTLGGFSTVKREGIELTAGFTAAANAEMRVGTVSETVTVAGTSPIVDVQNVVSQNVLGRDRMDALPASQAIAGLAALTLGVMPSASSGSFSDVGGNKGEQIASMAVHGGHQADEIAMIDGLSMQHTLNTGSGFFRLFFYNQLMAQEIGIVTHAGGAEVETSGVQVNMVPRSGGNTFKWNAVANGTNGDLQGRNIDDALKARGATAGPSVKNIYDFGVGAGGPFVQNRLWYYAATRAWGASEYLPANYYNKTNGTFIYTPDLDRPADRPNPNKDVSVRLTWQAGDKDRFTIFPAYQSNCNCRRGVDGSPPVAPEASEMGYFKPLLNLAGTWTRTMTNRFLLQAGFNRMDTHAWYAPAPEVQAGAIPLTELSTGLQYNSRVDTALNHFHDPQMNGYASATYVTGSHSFKTGVTFKRGYLDQWADSTSDPPLSYALQKATPTSIPTPVRITEIALPTHQRDDLSGLGLYAQDQWTIKRLTLDLGVRYDYFHGWVPAQTRPAGFFTPAYSFDMVDNVPNWKDVTPRIGAAYDLVGNGRTALKVSLGRYVNAESTTLSSANNPSNQIATSATRNWNDSFFGAGDSRTGNYVPDCDLHNPASNLECGALSSTTFGTLSSNTHYDPAVLTGFGVRPASWQGSALLQHELRPGLGLLVGYYRTWFVNQRVTKNRAVTPDAYDPFCVTLPNDSRLPNAGSALCGFYDIQPAFFGLTDNFVTSASNYGNASEVYNGFDVNVNARFAGGALLSGGVATGRTVTNNCFVVNSPQELRYCEVATPWSQFQSKVNLVYPLPFWDIRTSLVYQNMPGLAIAANGYVVPNAQIAGSLGRNLGSCRGQVPCTGNVSLSSLFEPNTQFEERLAQLDLRFSKIVRLGKGRMTANFDIYNLTNSNTILSRNNTYSPTSSAWGTPASVLAARLFKFGAQFDF